MDDETAKSDSKPVLIAYDGSESARAAILRAGELLGSRDAVVVSVTVAAPPLGIGSGPALDEIDETVDQETMSLAEEGAALARESGFEATAEFVRSSPAWEGIVKRADSLEASVVVLGSKGLSGVKYVLLGSVATAVSQNTRRPVLIVH